MAPEDHPLSVGFGFGPSGTPIAEEVFSECDLVLAIACKFGEVATSAYGFEPPRNLIHIDINPEVLGRNLPAAITLESDARAALESLITSLKNEGRSRGNLNLLSQVYVPFEQPVIRPDAYAPLPLRYPAAAGDLGPLQNPPLGDFRQPRHRLAFEIPLFPDQ